MSQENVEIVRRLMDAFNRQEVEVVEDLWAIDGEWRPAYFGGGLLEGAVFRGTAELARFVEQQAETWDSVVSEPEEIRDLGDRVVAKVRLSAIGRSSGIPVERVTWNVFEVRGGRIATGRVYLTEHDALEAAGPAE